jgi:hypothetical protein
MNKRDNIIKWSIISIFVGLYSLVSIISTIHVIDFFRLSNPNWLAVTLAIAFEIGAAASLAAIIILDKTSKALVWMLFILITAMQMMGNMYYAYTHLTEYTAWSELFGLIEEEVIYQKRILSLISGAILPIVALGFIKSLVDYIRPTRVEEIKQEPEKEKLIVEDPKIEELITDSVKEESNEKMLSDLFEEKLEEVGNEEPIEDIQEREIEKDLPETEENPHNITIESVENKEDWPPKEEIQFYKEPTEEMIEIKSEVKEPQTVNSIQELRDMNRMHA